jgi:hypothetical protein
MLLNRFLSLYILSGIVLSVFAREKTNAADYFYSKGLKAQFIFQEDFSEFSNYWPLGIGENSWSQSTTLSNIKGKLQRKPRF